jgi:cyclophilin family peptidyl-prolyl cis-trans isomerase
VQELKKKRIYSRPGASCPRLTFLGFLWTFGCVPIDGGNGGNDNQPPDDFSVTATTDTPEVFEGAIAVFQAVAADGTEPYAFRWDQNGGPADVEPDNLTTDVLSVGPFTTAGHYVFRLIGSDDDGAHATDYVAIEVLPAVTADAPELILVGDGVALTATVDPEVGDVELLWEITAGAGSLDDPNSATPTLTASEAGTLDVRLTVSLPGGSETTRTFEIVAVDDLTPQVLVETTLGDFTIELDGGRAPLHTANFLLYVDDGFYDGLLIHRVVCSQNPDTGECDPFVIQGGGYQRVGEEVEPVEATRDPVNAESDNGLSNGTIYSVALALGGGDPDSGTTQFFVNLDDNSFLDNQDFTVFGLVVEGTATIDAIAAVETTDSPILTGEASLPVEDVVIERVTRLPMAN